MLRRNSLFSDSDLDDDEELIYLNQLQASLKEKGIIIPKDSRDIQLKFFPDLVKTPEPEPEPDPSSPWKKKIELVS